MDAKTSMSVWKWKIYWTDLLSILIKTFGLSLQKQRKSSRQIY